MAQQTPEFKLVLVGDGGVGKFESYLNDEIFSFIISIKEKQRSLNDI